MTTCTSLASRSRSRSAALYGSVEAAYNFGENRYVDTGNNQATPRYDGKAVLADVGYKADVEQVGTFNPWAQFGYGSGEEQGQARNHNENFTSIATDYRPGAIYGRFDKNTGAKLDNGNGVSAAGASERLGQPHHLGRGLQGDPVGDQ